MDIATTKAKFPWNFGRLRRLGVFTPLLCLNIHIKLAERALCAESLSYYRGGDLTESKQFLKNDSGFVCKNCNKQVLPLGYTSRNHCPFCLYSLHLDINPGDRKSECGGLMEPVSALPDPKKGYIIIHRCKKCGELHRNKAAHEAKVQPDNLRLIISLTSKQI